MQIGILKSSQDGLAALVNCALVFLDSLFGL